MAIENFEDHCWKDVVTPEILKTYTPYQRETYIGQRPALLAIDLYNLAYEGGAKEPHELVDTYKSSCGIYAHDQPPAGKDRSSSIRDQGGVQTSIGRRGHLQRTGKWIFWHAACRSSHSIGN